MTVFFEIAESPLLYIHENMSSVFNYKSFQRTLHITRLIPQAISSP